MAVPSFGGTDAFILYSGSPNAFDARHDTLSAFGTASFAGTDAGMAALYDLAMLNGMYGMLGGFLHAVAIVDTGGVRAGEFVSDWLVPWLQAVIGLMPEMARQIDTGDYAATESNLAMQTTGVGLVDSSESIGINSALVAPLERLMKARVADGHGGDEVSSVTELVKKPDSR